VTLVDGIHVADAYDSFFAVDLDHFVEGASTGRTDLKACRRLSVLHAPLTQGALLENVRVGCDVASLVWASRNTQATPDAQILIHENSSVFGLERRTRWTGVHTGRILTVVAEVWGE
jgi:hypothetical protein